MLQLVQASGARHWSLAFRGMQATALCGRQSCLQAAFQDAVEQTHPVRRYFSGFVFRRHLAAKPEKFVAYRKRRPERPPAGKIACRTNGQNREVSGACLRHPLYNPTADGGRVGPSIPLWDMLQLVHARRAEPANAGLPPGDKLKHVLPRSSRQNDHRPGHIVLQIPGSFVLKRHGVVDVDLVTGSIHIQLLTVG